MKSNGLQKNDFIHLGMIAVILELLLHKNNIDYKRDVRYNHNMEDIL